MSHVYAKDVFLNPKEGRWEYRITQDGEVAIRQDYHPDLPGFAVMDQPTANAAADAVLARLVAADAAAVSAAAPPSISTVVAADTAVLLAQLQQALAGKMTP